MADHKVRKSGSWLKPGTDAIKAKSAGVWKTVQKVYARSGGVWKEVWTNYTPMSTPSVGATTLSNEQIATDANTTCVASTTCSIPSGGSGTKTYTWEKVSGTTLTVSQGRTVTFSRTAGGVQTSSIYRCKVTDGTGASVYSNNVTINFVHWKFQEASLPTNKSDFATYPSTASATISFSRAGSGTTATNWIAPASSTVGDLFEIYFNFTSGSPSSGSTTGTALTINTTRSQTVEQSVSNINSPLASNQATCRVRIRKKTGGGWLFDKSCTMTASCEGGNL